MALLAALALGIAVAPAAAAASASSACAQPGVHRINPLVGKGCERITAVHSRVTLGAPSKRLDRSELALLRTRVANRTPWR